MSSLRTRRSITVAVAGLLLALSPAVPVRAHAAPVPQPADVGQDCATKVRQAVTARGSGRAYVNCVQPLGPAQVAEGGMSATAACGSNSWAFTRQYACSANNATLYIIERSTGAIVGQMNYIATSEVRVNGRSDRWNHYLTISAQSGWGAINGLTVSARAECGTSCNRVVVYNFDSGSALPGNTRTGGATLESAFHGINAIWHPYSQWTWWFTSPNTAPPDSNPLTFPGPEHRCDSTLGPSTAAGCAFPQVRPVHDIAEGRYPKYARHIQLAINYYHMTDVLTRTTDSELNALNGRIACPPTDADHPRPDGHTCDEYPFRSTYEGAASHGYGKTMFIFNWNTSYEFRCNVKWLSTRQLGDTGGYSVCMVPAGENSGGGTDLGIFYYDNRVIDRDQFQVRIVP